MISEMAILGAAMGTENRHLRDRRVTHARRPEALEQSDGRLEYAAGTADVFTEEHDVLVALHLLRDRRCDRVAVGQFRHVDVPSA